MDQFYDPFQQQGQKNQFLKQRKQEKQQKENQKRMKLAVDKISSYYKRSQDYLEVKKKVQALGVNRIKTILQLEAMFKQNHNVQKYFQTCDVALQKYIEILRPLFFINHSNCSKSINQIELTLQLNIHALQSNPPNFIRNINQNTFQAQKFYIGKLITLSFNSKLYPLLDQFFSTLFTTLKADNKENKKYFLHWIYQKIGKAQLILTFNQDMTPYPGLVKLLYKFCKQEFDQDIYYILLQQRNIKFKPSFIKNLQNDSVYQNFMLLDQIQNQNKLWNLYQKFKQIDVTFHLKELKRIILKLELNYFQTELKSIYKNIKDSEIEEENPKKTDYEFNAKLLRNDLKYQKFLQQLDVNFWFSPNKLESYSYILQKDDEMNLLCEVFEFLNFLVRLCVSRKYELRLKIFNNPLLQLACQSKIKNLKYDVIKKQQEQYGTVIEFISQIQLIKMMILDDIEFEEEYLKQSNQFFINMTRIFLQLMYFDILLQDQFNKSIFYKGSPHFIKAKKSIGQLLQEIYMRDNRIHFTSNDFWVIQEANNLLEIYTPNSNQYWYFSELLKDLPFVLKFENRYKKFYNHIEDDKKGQNRNPGELYQFNEDGQMVIDHNRIVEIRRNQELEDAYAQLELGNVKQLFHVKFFNELGMEEVGVDGGGITKEFLIRVINQAFDPKIGLFVETPEHSLIPNPYYFMDDLLKYQFVGKLVGKAIYEGVLIEPILSRVFINKILNRRNNINELRYYDKTIYDSMMKMKKQKVEGMGMTFSISESIYGSIKSIELKADGINIEVNESNKEEFILLYTDFKLNKQIEKQCEYFRKGLNLVIESEWFGMFNYQELQLLISGAPTINFQDLRKHTKYNGFQAFDQTIQDLWCVLEQFEPIEQQKFLHFVTSCSRAPTLGFKSLDPPFCIQNSSSGDLYDNQRLPTAQTCFNILKIPDYRNIEILHGKLLQAIRSNVGFELT